MMNKSLLAFALFATTGLAIAEPASYARAYHVHLTLSATDGVHAPEVLAVSDQVVPVQTSTTARVVYAIPVMTGCTDADLHCGQHRQMEVTGKFGLAPPSQNVEGEGTVLISFDSLRVNEIGLTAAGKRDTEDMSTIVDEAPSVDASLGQSVVLGAGRFGARAIIVSAVLTK
jgi:hypothetical protein